MFKKIFFLIILGVLFSSQVFAVGNTAAKKPLALIFNKKNVNTKPQVKKGVKSASVTKKVIKKQAPKKVQKKIQKEVKERKVKTKAKSETLNKKPKTAPITAALIVPILATSTTSNPVPLPAPTATVTPAIAPVEKPMPPDFILEGKRRAWLTSFGGFMKSYDTGYWTVDYPYWLLQWTFADLTNYGNGSGQFITFNIYKRNNNGEESLVDTIVAKKDGYKYLKGSGAFRVKAETSDYAGWSVDIRVILDN